MAQITVTFDSYEEMKTFAEELLGTENAPVSADSKEVPAQTQSVPVSQPAPAGTSNASNNRTGTCADGANSTNSAAPVTPVPTTERTYTLDELANAAMTLMDKGMQSQLQELLASYGVEALLHFRRICMETLQLRLEEWGQISNGTCRKSTRTVKRIRCTSLAGVHTEREAGGTVSAYSHRKQPKRVRWRTNWQSCGYGHYF